MMHWWQSRRRIYKELQKAAFVLGEKPLYYSLNDWRAAAFYRKFYRLLFGILRNQFIHLQNMIDEPVL